MKTEKTSTTTLLLAFNIILVLVGMLIINSKIVNNDEKSDSLKTKINQIETQLDVLIDDARQAKQQVIVANEDFVQLSNSMAVNDKILKNLDSEIKGAVKEIKEVKNMTELQNRKLYISE
jgi:Tfp pilus assembly protein PilN|tara:strand:- start:127 stop:486 length:360 start_codon:yes stop_codon:yes gene_type:complete